MRKMVSFADLMMFAEAWWLLLFARVVLILRPFRKIASMLGKTMQEAPPNAVSAMEKQEKVKLAILRASRFSPWRTRCFEQAIAAKIMLGKRHMHSTVYFGVFKNDDSEMCAHAWLVSNDAIVTGGPKIDHITVLSWFGS